MRSRMRIPERAAGTTGETTAPGVGAAGWYLAIDDIAKVLYSLNANDGRILTSAQLQDMEATQMGWDTTTDRVGYRWVEKNGGWGSSGTTISTSIALFGPGVYGALFMNSDVSGPGRRLTGRGARSARHWLRRERERRSVSVRRHA